MDLLADEPVVEKKKSSFVDMLADEPVGSVPIPKIIGQEKPQSMLEKYILESDPIQDVKTAVGLAETGLAMATHIPAKVYSGYKTAVKLPLVGELEAEKLGQEAEERYSFQPRTKRGKDISRLISTPIEKLSEYGKKRADLEFEESGSWVAAGAKKTIYDFAPYLIGTKGGIKAAKAAKGRLVKAKEAAKIPELKTSQDAIKFGKDATPAQIKELHKLREKTLLENERLLKESKAKADVPRVQTVPASSTKAEPVAPDGFPIQHTNCMKVGYVSASNR